MSDDKAKTVDVQQGGHLMHQLSLDIQTTIMDTLPAKPYATDDFECGLRIHNKQKAATKRYIQLNHKYVTQWLTFDIDQDDAVTGFYDDALGMPTPNMMVQNQDNGRAHFLYLLQTPVLHYPSASIKPIQYLDAIYSEIRHGLGADMGYSGLISKNPLNSHWRTFETRTSPYTLGELASHLDLSDREVKRYKVDPEQGFNLGRNQTLFNGLRDWAYIAVRDHRGTTYAVWYESCLKQADMMNKANVFPLPYSEIKSIAKSVSKFCWRNDPYAYQEFINRQSCKGKVGGAVRSAKYDTRRELAQQLHSQGVSKAEIARQLHVARYTVSRWLSNKGAQCPKSDI